MKIGMIGLGKMGLHLTQNMLHNQVEVVAYDVTAKAVEEAEQLGAEPAKDLQTLVAKLPAPRIIWVMIPAGAPTQETVRKLGDLLQPGDILIDGGNSFYEDSIKRGEELAAKQIHFFDVGSSGGMAGALKDGNFMIGGPAEIFPVIEPLFKKIAAEKGYLYTGPSGSGHYLKMVHNGIEYGMMQAIGEGFDLLQHSPYNYNNEKVAEMWNHGSVIRSWLMELAANAFQKDGQLDEIKGIMYSSGEGKWTVEEALKREVAMPVIATSLMMRYRSLEEDTFTGKVVAALRNEFGGHAVSKKE
ncbi:phosphogluconate dehydrogenase (NAD(+)-dependent, decarboxylating) [Enterococcus sp. JM9B]|uniref:phosphogluconate dehydrogenase (NAD(+)-dependent, decarboxylating) n=1 Tax=Enterococcus sp. JM9B TaxID=1857216 RepID=UPI0013752D23|nr:decarboxylating 6-phosphogluconate dehydrogenase [Enterococcus sp. JM9B]KAF1301629.1 6-phosphogluconate dehydrogenase (decarboxylating) [Enterococcus sp. JM9B]